VDPPALQIYFIFLARKNNLVDRKKKIAYLTNPRVLEDPYYTENMDAMQTMKKMADKEGRRYMVVLLPILVDLKKETFKMVFERLVSELEDRGILVLDLSNDLKDFEDSDLWILPFDQHPNEIANRIFAEKLFQRYRDAFVSL
jgi:hypothetical protein